MINLADKFAKWRAPGRWSKPRSGGNGAFIGGAQSGVPNLTNFNRAETWIQKSEETVGYPLMLFVIEI